MATTTPNFGWPVPTSSDLVKNGATAIEGLGDAIDASLLDLKGGTTGQVLAKASNTDMDFSWTTPSSGGATFVGANATKTADQSLSNATITSISFDGTDIVDTNGFHDPSTNNTRMTIPTGYAGKYEVTAQLQWSQNTSGGREVYFRKNGSTDLQVIQAAASGSTNMTISGIYTLAVADYIEVRGYQSSGGSLAVQGTNSGYTNCSSFQVKYLGA
jgi:hypothetical protein